MKIIINYQTVSKSKVLSWLLRQATKNKHVRIGFVGGYGVTPAKLWIWWKGYKHG